MSKKTKRHAIHAPVHRYIDFFNLQIPRKTYPPTMMQNMSSNDDGCKRPVIQDPLVRLVSYELAPNYDDDIIPGPPIEFKSLFEGIREAPTGIPLTPKDATLNYMYNIVEKVYGSEYSPRSHSQMRFDMNMHVDAFLRENKDNPRGLYCNTSQEQMIPRQFFSYIIYKSVREGRSIQAWVGYPLQTFIGKSTDETKTTTTSSRQFFDANSGLKFTPHCTRPKHLL